MKYMLDINNEYRPHLILGNMKDIPQSEEWVGYTDIGKRFGTFPSELIIRYESEPRCKGEIAFLKVFSTSMVVMNSYRVATELLEKRGSNYSGRPVSVMANDLYDPVCCTIDDHEQMPLGVT